MNKFLFGLIFSSIVGLFSFTIIPAFAFDASQTPHCNGGMDDDGKDGDE